MTTSGADVNADTTRSGERAPSGTDTRSRILTAAQELFYAHGIRATSADRIIEEVGITKVTFYRHFRTKGQLVVAYLEQQAESERRYLEAMSHRGEPEKSLREVAEGIGAASCSPGFRGCAFINAAAEYSDPDDPVRAAVDAHRQWTLEYFGAIAADAGVDDVDSAARQLMLLRDGAMVNGYLGQPATVAESLGRAFASIISGLHAKEGPTSAAS
jgi:AcrR family transcriptional regulator